MKIVAWGLGVLLFFIGAGLLVVAAKFSNADSDIAAAGGRAEGVVIDVVGQRGSRGKVTYRPIVAFTDQTGQRRSFASKVSSSPPSYERGEKVTVLYDPANPADATIDSFVERYLGALMFGIMGAIFTLIGIWVLFGLWKRQLHGR